MLMQLSSHGSSKMEIVETVFFYILTIQNDTISSLKYILGPLYMFFTLFGCWGRGVPRGLGHTQPASTAFQLRQLKNGNFEIDFFSIFWPSKMIKYPT